MYSEREIEKEAGKEEIEIREGVVYYTARENKKALVVLLADA